MKNIENYRIALFSLMKGALVGAVIASGVAFVFGYINAHLKHDKLTRAYLTEYDKSFKCIMGSTSPILYQPPAKYTSKGGYLLYKICTFDAGIHWYAIDVYSDNQGMAIIGDVHKIFPGLKEKLDYLDSLSEEPKSEK